MITSSNFFNKNLFVGEEDDYKGELDEDRWLPVSSRKPYATIEMLNQTNSHKNASQKSNSLLPSIQRNQKMQNEMPSHSSRCRFKQKNKQQRHVYKRFNDKKSIQSTNFEYEDKLPKSNRYYQGYQASNKEDDDNHSTLGAFLNTKRLKSLQKYTIQSIKSEQKHENKKGALNNVPKGTQIQLIEEITRAERCNGKKIDLGKSRNYSPLANQLNFILKSRQKYEKSLVNRSNAKKNLYKSIEITSKYPSERLNREKTSLASKMMINKL